MTHKPANFNGQNHLPEVPRLTIKDWTNNQNTLAEKHIRRCPEGGYYITYSRPPESIAQVQRERNGHQPLQFFDAENRRKNIEGVSGPINCSGLIDQDRLNQEQVAALLNLRAEVKPGIAKRHFNHVSRGPRL